MKYVAALPSIGRVGHQFSQMFSARWLAAVCGLKYLHADFVNGPAWNDQAALWNRFFEFGKDLPQLDEVAHNTLSLRFGRPIPPREPLRRDPLLADYHSIVKGLPEEWVLYFADFGTCWYDAYHLSPNHFQRVAKLFQKSAFASPMYRAQATRFQPDQGVSIVGYYRTGGTRETLDGRWVIPEMQYLRTIKSLWSYFGKQTARPIVYTQGPARLFGSDWDGIEVVICDDEYPLVFEAMKTCIEADLFVGSTGGTNSLIRTLRHDRKLSVGFITPSQAAATYPDGPNADTDGFLDLKITIDDLRK